MGTPISGKDGSASFGSAIADVTNWKATLESDDKSYASSDTAGYEKTVEGIKSWSGSFDFKLDEGDPANAPIEGSVAALSLITTGVHGVSGNAIIDTVELEDDVEGGEIVGGSCTFTGKLVATLD